MKLIENVDNLQYGYSIFALVPTNYQHQYDNPQYVIYIYFRIAPTGVMLNLLCHVEF